uniref:Uncharacterized protein n=1 Tax=Fundulus heteroclitus TaxID=8078 RepID=A0A3Q2SY93_FUNHE
RVSGSHATHFDWRLFFLSGPVTYCPGWNQLFVHTRITCNWLTVSSISIHRLALANYTDIWSRPHLRKQSPYSGKRKSVFIDHYFLLSNYVRLNGSPDLTFFANHKMNARI